MSKNTQKTDLVAESYCYSKVNFQKCNYVWIIEHYQNVHTKVKMPIKSAPFSAFNDDLKWTLHHEFRDKDFFLEVRLQTTRIEVDKCGPVFGEVKFSIVNPDYSKIIISNQANFEMKTSYIGYLIKDTDPHELKGGGYTYFHKYSNHLTEWLYEDKMTIFCELNFAKIGNIIPITNSLYSNLGEQPQFTLLRDVEKLFSDKRHSDITVSVEDENFQVHKAILAARSSVFDAMFKNDMQESASNHVDITDIDKKTFEKMLRYIYTGKIDDLEESVFELLSAADKYDLKELRMMCEEEMSKQLSKGSEKTVIKILIFADMYNAHQLKALTFQFIRMHTVGKNVEDTEVWKIIKESYPHLMPEMITAFLKQ